MEVVRVHMCRGRTDVCPMWVIVVVAVCAVVGGMYVFQCLWYVCELFLGGDVDMCLCGCLGVSRGRSDVWPMWVIAVVVVCAL